MPDNKITEVKPRHNRFVAMIYSLGSVLLVAALVVGMFFGARWLYQKARDNNSDNRTNNTETSSQANPSDSTSNDSDGNTESSQNSTTNTTVNGIQSTNQSSLPDTGDNDILFPQSNPNNW